MSCLLCSHRKRALTEVVESHASCSVPSLPSSQGGGSTSSGKQTVLTEPSSLEGKSASVGGESDPQQQQQQQRRKQPQPQLELERSQSNRTTASGASIRTAAVGGDDNDAASTTTTPSIGASIATKQSSVSTTTKKSNGGTKSDKSKPKTKAAEAKKDNKSKSSSGPSNNHPPPSKNATKSFVRPGTSLPAPYDYKPLLHDSEETIPLRVDYPTGRYGGWYDARLVRVPVVVARRREGVGAREGVGTKNQGGPGAVTMSRVGKPIRHTVGLSTLWLWDWPPNWVYAIEGSSGGGSVPDTATPGKTSDGTVAGTTNTTSVPGKTSAAVGWVDCRKKRRSGYGESIVSVPSIPEGASPGLDPIPESGADAEFDAGVDAADADSNADVDAGGAIVANATPVGGSRNGDGGNGDGDVWTDLNQHVPGAAVGFGGTFPFDSYLREEDEYKRIGVDPIDQNEDDDEETSTLVFTPVQYEFADFEGVEATEASEAAAEAGAAAYKQMRAPTSPISAASPSSPPPPPAPVTTPISLSPDQIRRAEKMHTDARLRARHELGLTEMFDWNVDKHSTKRCQMVKFDIDEIVIGDDNVSTISDDVSLPAALVELARRIEMAGEDGNAGLAAAAAAGIGVSVVGGEEGGGASSSDKDARASVEKEDEDEDEEASATKEKEPVVVYVDRQGSIASGMSGGVQAMLATAEAVRVWKHQTSDPDSPHVLALSEDEDSREVESSDRGPVVGDGSVDGSVSYSESESSGYVSNAEEEDYDDDDDDEQKNAQGGCSGRRGVVSNVATAARELQDDEWPEDDKRLIVPQVVFNEPRPEETDGYKVTCVSAQEEEGEETLQEEETQAQVQPPKDKEKKTRRPMPRTRQRSVRIGARKKITWDEAGVGAFPTAVERSKMKEIESEAGQTTMTEECSSTAQHTTNDPEIIEGPLESDAPTSSSKLDLAALEDEPWEDDRVSILTDGVEGDEPSDGFTRDGNGTWTVATVRHPLSLMQLDEGLPTVEESPSESTTIASPDVAATEEGGNTDEVDEPTCAEEDGNPAEVDESTRADKCARTVNPAKEECPTTSAASEADGTKSSPRKSKIPPPTRRKNVASPVFSSATRKSCLALKLGQRDDAAKGCEDSVRTIETECSTHPSDDGSSVPMPSPVPTTGNGVVGSDARARRRAIETKFQASKSPSLRDSVSGTQARSSARTLEVAILNSLKERINESVRITDVTDLEQKGTMGSAPTRPPSHDMDVGPMMQRLKSERERTQSRSMLLRQVGREEGASN